MKVFIVDFLSREDKEMTNMAGDLRRMPPRDRARERSRKKSTSIPGISKNKQLKRSMTIVSFHTDCCMHRALEKQDTGKAPGGTGGKWMR